jgi:translation elongation factor EF-4
VHTSEADKLSKSAEKLENKQAHDVIDAEESSESENHLKAFLFDARYVPNRGVACLIKIMGGGQLDWAKLKFLTSYHTGIKYDLYDVGIVQPQMKKTGYLPQGQVGYFLSNMKSVSEAHIGDTFFDDKVQKEQIRPLPGYETPQSMVYSGIYPEDPDDYEELEKSLKKLCLTDGSISISYESSAALGSGFRCGFLGMLHLDVFRQRLIDEYDMSAIIT